MKILNIFLPQQNDYPTGLCPHPKECNECCSRQRILYTFGFTLVHQKSHQSSFGPRQVYFGSQRSTCHNLPMSVIDVSSKRMLNNTSPGVMPSQPLLTVTVTHVSTYSHTQVGHKKMLPR